jgi:hypothetical protein
MQSEPALRTYPTGEQDEPAGWLTRSRLLKAFGGGLFAFSTGMLVRADPALAQHNPPPSPCFGFPECHYCTQSNCTQYCWWPHSRGNGHCPYGYNQYWETCTSSGNWWRCRDWHEQFPGHSAHHCLCRGSLGRC